MADVLISIFSIIKKMLQNLSRTGCFSCFESRTGYHFKAFLGQEQGLSFVVPAAQPHPKIWKYPPGGIYRSLFFLRGYSKACA